MNNQLKIAFQYQQRGDLNVAAAIYKQLLIDDPEHYEALHLLGMVAFEQESFQDAIQLFNKALKHDSDSPYLRNNLGNALAEEGEYEKAISHLQKALEIDPSFSETYINLGSVYQKLGQSDKAIEYYRQSIGDDSESDLVYNNLGNLLQEQGHTKEAIQYYQKAIELNPQLYEAFFNLGNIYKDSEQIDKAIHFYTQAVQLNPDFALACNNLGVMYKLKGELEQAEHYYRHAIEINPEFLEACNNLGIVLREQGFLEKSLYYHQQALEINQQIPAIHQSIGVVLHELGRVNEAIQYYKQALKLNPAIPAIHNNLGLIYKEKNLYTEASVHIQHAIDLQPTPDTYNNLALTLQAQGRLKAAFVNFLTACSQDKDNQFSYIYSNLLYCLSYMPGITARMFFDKTQEWKHNYLQPQSNTNFKNNSDPQRVLNVGFILSNSREDQYINQLIPYFSSKIKPFLYYDYQAYVKSTTIPRRKVWNIDKEALLHIIGDDLIDVLIDLGGHHENNRLELLALKPAPVILTGFKSYFTTGLSTIDYMISSSSNLSLKNIKWQSEKVLYTPNKIHWFPPDIEEAITTSPFEKNQYITFGSDNELYKINEDVIAYWSNLLKYIPNSHLRIHAPQFKDQNTRQYYLECFTKQKIHFNRIHLLAKTTSDLSFYDSVDIALAPFPNQQVDSIFEALWMGVPVIVLNESTTNAQILEHLGLNELVANSNQSYIKLAKALAHNYELLRLLRTNLRDKLKQSIFLQTSHYVYQLEQVYRRTWMIWCDQRN